MSLEQKSDEIRDQISRQLHEFNTTEQPNQPNILLSDLYITGSQPNNPTPNSDWDVVISVTNTTPPTLEQYLKTNTDRNIDITIAENAKQEATQMAEHGGHNHIYDATTYDLLSVG